MEWREYSFGYFQEALFVALRTLWIYAAPQSGAPSADRGVVALLHAGAACAGSEEVLTKHRTLGREAQFFQDDITASTNSALAMRDISSQKLCVHYEALGLRALDSSRYPHLLFLEFIFLPAPTRGLPPGFDRSPDTIDGRESMSIRFFSFFAFLLVPSTPPIAFTYSF